MLKNFVLKKSKNFVLKNLVLKNFVLKKSKNFYVKKFRVEKHAIIKKFRGKTNSC